jgi:hypothetical protein
MSTGTDKITVPVDAKKTFHAALLAFHNDLEVIKRDESNPFFKSKYVPLPKMLSAIRPVAAKHGFILSQPTDIINTQQGAMNVVTTFLTHAETGLSESAKIMLEKQADMQKLGAAITYGRRQTLSSLVGAEEEDDDGNYLTGKVAPKTTKSVASNKDKF